MRVLKDEGLSTVPPRQSTPSERSIVINGQAPCHELTLEALSPVPPASAGSQSAPDQAGQSSLPLGLWAEGRLFTIVNEAPFISAAKHGHPKHSFATWVLNPNCRSATSCHFQQIMYMITEWPSGR